jgi:hypothetical protein
VSVCHSSQPDTAVQPAKEHASYTTCWDRIARVILTHDAEPCPAGEIARTRPASLWAILT